MLGVGAAYAYSVVAVLFPSLFPESFRHNGEAQLYFEAGAVITTLILIGQWLEARARRQTGTAIKPARISLQILNMRHFSECRGSFRERLQT